MKFFSKRVLTGASVLALSVSFAAAQPASATTFYDVNIQAGWGTLVGSGHFNSATAWIFNGNEADKSCDNQTIATDILIFYTDGSIGEAYFPNGEGCGHSVGVGYTQNPAPGPIRNVEIQLLRIDSHGTVQDSAREYVGP